MTGVPALEVSDTDPTPPYEQLRRQLAALIGDGTLAVGDRLPPLRQLAADLGLATGTVARTYRELEGAGLVRSGRGGGTRVAAAPTDPPERAERRSRLQAHAAAYLHQARLVGADLDEAVAALRAAAGHRAGPGGAGRK